MRATSSLKIKNKHKEKQLSCCLPWLGDYMQFKLMRETSGTGPSQYDGQLGTPFNLSCPLSSYFLESGYYCWSSRKLLGRRETLRMKSRTQIGKTQSQRLSQWLMTSALHPGQPISPACTIQGRCSSPSTLVVCFFSGANFFWP